MFFSSSWAWKSMAFPESLKATCGHVTGFSQGNMGGSDYTPSRTGPHGILALFFYLPAEWRELQGPTWKGSGLLSNIQRKPPTPTHLHWAMA